MDGETGVADAEELLAVVRASEARYRALVLASSQMVWRTDPYGNVLDNTDAWEKATGQAQAQSNGWGWVDVVHPDDRGPTLEHWRRCLLAAVPYEREYRILADGAWRWVLARAVPVRDEAGAVREWIGTSIDVDATHRAAARLREVAADLQQGLAPGDVPDVPGFELAAVYRPGGDAVELVGGDWYDLLPLHDGRVALVVGDVMGRGVHAATTMAAVSAAVRAYALLDPDPGVLLGRLDAFAAEHAPDQFVTLFYGLLEPATGRLAFALAGHLAPLRLHGTPTGAARAALHDAAAGPPLGLEGPRPVHVLELGPGEGVVVLTDGVVERRDRSLDEGLAAAERAASGAGGTATLAAAVADANPPSAGVEAGGADGDDDVTVLAVRRVRPSAPPGPPAGGTLEA